MTRRPLLPVFLLAAAATGADDWETKFRAVPDPARLRQYVEFMAARPHHLGSPYGKQVADWILARFQEWGWDARIETYEVLFPTPKERLLEMTAPTRFTAKLAEPAVAADPTSSQQSEQLPTYNAYSTDGDVSGPLVYVNYGVPDDYKELERRGVSVKGAVVIARYGASWRGIKPKVAAEHGAVGCIIYSDPKDDGYHQGEVFPEGPYRPRDGAQRGSVMDMPVYPGDPLTPGIGALPGAKRLDRKQVQTITKIPVLPISYGDAQPLLAALQGPVAPESWRGALPITYRIGPGAARVRLKLSFNWDIVKLHNVIARMPGAEFPDEWVIRGNHHDAWVNGAQDPVSGMAVVLEEARALGELKKAGWKPRRTLIYCAWDGEEQALLGSTEWAETHAAELKRKAVAYINSDANGRGYLGMSGSHTLERLMNDVAKSVEDPEKKIPVWKRLQLSRIASAAARRDARSRADLRMGALGSGSDYTAFIDHLGVASLNLGFGGEDGGGIYHSIYDDFYWYTKFSDTDFRYGRALAQVAGTAVMRLAAADVLPLRFSNLADTVARYAAEVQELANTQRDGIVERNKQLEEGVFEATSDPKRPLLPPAREPVPPYLNFAPLQNAVRALEEAAARYDAAAAKAKPRNLAALNRKLLAFEQSLTHADGLRRRPWFQHMIYAPGFYTGYGVKTLPGVREAIEQKQWQEADAEIARLAGVLERAAQAIDEARAAL